MAAPKKSNRQRRAELVAKRKTRADKLEKECQSKREAERQALWQKEADRGELVDRSQLAPDGSYSRPEFAERGYYLDIPFTCRECGKEEVFTAAQQKWWYEVAKGNVWTGARYCRQCRQNERARRTEARRVHLEGIARKRPSSE
jgi:hypothetical protein